MTKIPTRSDALIFDEHWKRPPSGWPAAPLQTGFSPKVSDRIIKESLREWVVSPSRSLFRALKNTPSPGAPIFDNLLDQTRFLVSLNSVLSKCKLEKLRGMKPVTRNGRPVMVAGSSPGMTISDVCDPKVNDVMRCLTTYAARQNVAVPNHERRRLYRGIRTHDVWGNIGIRATNILTSDIELLSHFSSASRTDSVYENMALSIIQREAAFLLLTSRPLGSLSENTVLSFTAQKKMAEYFTNNIGFVVSVDPAAHGFSIVASPAAEPFLEEKDPVSLKN